jgi:DNA polymerase-3 subunit gamma/tau
VSNDLATSAENPASYLVLARKYRPQRFEDLVGQEHVARTVTNAIELNRVHHAFLFTGARGVGKTSAARILAKALCCETGPTATPCGVCGFCQEIASGQSVDVVEIDGASNRGVEDARNLRESVRYAPARGRKKVYIIDEVHMFTTEAFNALLKTLEEPPPHVVFILATTEVHKLPITILSRTQRYDFKLIPTGRLTEHLGEILKKEGIAFEEPGLRLLARQAAGSVRDALSLLDQIIAYVGDAPVTEQKVVDVLGVADRRLLLGLFAAVIDRQAGAALRLLAEAIDKGIDLVQLGRAFLGFIHDAEMMAILENPGDLVDATAEEIVETRALGARAPRGLAGVLFDRWARAVEEATKSQTPRLILEMALVDLCALEPLLPLGDLLARLEELETRLGEGGGPRPPGGRPSSEGGGPPARAVAAAPAPASAPPSRPPAGDRAGPPAAREVPAPAPAPVVPAATPPVARAPGPTSLAPPGGAAAASPAPPPAGPGEAWNILRLRLQDRPALAAALDHAAVESWEPGRVSILLPDKLLLDQTEKNRRFVEQALAELAGGPVTFICKLGGTARSVVSSEVSREAESAERDRRLRVDEARKHPMIQKAQELFGVAPREIKVS